MCTWRYIRFFETGCIRYIVNLNQIQWNPTFFMTSFIAIISLFGSFKFTQSREMEKFVKKLMKKEIVNLEPLLKKIISGVLL